MAEEPGDRCRAYSAVSHATLDSSANIVTGKASDSSCNSTAKAAECWVRPMRSAVSRVLKLRTNTDSELGRQAVQDRIRSGQIVLQRIRCNVAACVLLGYVVVGVFTHFGQGSWSATSDTTDLCTTGLRVRLGFGLLAFGWYCRVVCIGLAPLADSLWVTRLVLVMQSVIICLGVYQHVQEFQHRLVGEGKDDPATYPEWLMWFHLVSCITRDLVFVVGTGWALCCKTARSLEQRVWTVIAVWVAACLTVTVCLYFARTQVCHTLQPSSLWWLPTGTASWLIAHSLALLASLRSGWRHTIQSRLNRLFEAESAQRAAASVAGLVGESTAKAAYAQASQRFRSIRLTQLSSADLADNTPNDDLFQRTAPAKLQHCDVFVSHSWHDDSASKWAAMQRWRTEFVHSQGHEPTMWLDKCCIDQRNIEADLRCLPLFLSGCRRMVVFCGPTYLTRLWCVVELFTFVHCGRHIGDLSFCPLLREGRELEDLRLLEEGFTNFDAEQCTCSVPGDKERLLHIFRTSFGDLKRFNSAVQAIFSQTGWEVQLRRMQSERTVWTIQHPAFGEETAEQEGEWTPTTEEVAGQSDVSPESVRWGSETP